jgi:hypothetical protein
MNEIWLFKDYYTIHLIYCGLIIDVDVDQEVRECHLTSDCKFVSTYVLHEDWM